MFNAIDLQELSEREGPERAFVSLYLSSPDALQRFEDRIVRVRDILDEDSDEMQHFERNVEQIRAALDEVSYKEGALSMFSCWALDYIQAFSFEGDVPDLLWVGNAPYLRPLAELQDEYENFVVVTADNSEAHIFRVTSAAPEEEERIVGDVKNHVKKGGWSQQRYARRREEELKDYAQDVAEALAELAKAWPFERWFLLGSDEAMRAVEEELPQALQEKLAGRQAVDLHQEDEVWDAAFELFFQEERREERSLWDRIKNEVLQQGRGATGPEKVLDAAAVGRVERLLVTRDAKLKGWRCQECENMTADEMEECRVCGSDDVFVVDLVEELVQLVTRHQGSVEFSDRIRGLTKSGHVAALLRY